MYGGGASAYGVRPRVAVKRSQKRKASKIVFVNGQQYRQVGGQKRVSRPRVNVVRNPTFNPFGSNKGKKNKKSLQYMIHNL